MSYQANFRGWENLQLEDLLVAYRKAKADCFFENTFPTAVKFARYEQNLLKNLNNLLTQLKKEKGFKVNKRLLGDFRVVPKKLKIEKKDTSSVGHVHFSDPEKILDSLFSENKLEPSFRIIGDFPVETHIISALWINMIGEKFDEKLTDSCYGARLKRIDNDSPISTYKPFHISATGSFLPYFQPYQKWRNDGLNAIREELEKDNSVIAVSLDLKSYYHYIDPKIISSKKLRDSFGLELNNQEVLFTKQLAIFLTKWAEEAVNFSKKISDQSETISGGLAIGLTASRIISNMILHQWDKLINEKLTPIHYGRYVDDMFLVLKDTGNITNSDKLMKFLRERLGSKVLVQDANQTNNWSINQPYLKNNKTQIRLQSNKQKLFILQGQMGLDLLDSIEKDIYELSSEHRLMPSPDQLDKSTAAKVLSAAGSVGENADTLRRADGLTIRRLSWSLQLRHVETLARDLPPKVWKEQRDEFYQFAHNHILRADVIFDHFTYLPRLLGFAIGLNEWQQALQIVLKSYKALDVIKDRIFEPQGEINGTKCQLREDIWKYIAGSLTILFIDAATKYFDSKKLFKEQETKQREIEKLFFKRLIDNINSFNDLVNFDQNINNFYNNAPLVAKADLAKIPYKEILNFKESKQLFESSLSEKNKLIKTAFKKIDLISFESLQNFLKSSYKKRLKYIDQNKYSYENYMPYLFPTRPYTPSEISELAPECVGLLTNDGKVCTTRPALIWANYTQAVRGVWIKPSLLAMENDKQNYSIRENSESKKPRRFLRIGTNNKDNVIVALTNLKISQKDWASSAANKPNLSLDRYQRISDLVNDILRLKPKPDYVIFPELSIPLDWVDSIALRLCSLGISIIAGTEYRHTGDAKLISEAVLILADNRLGYSTFSKIWQPKLEPAVAEDKDLISIYGKEWDFDITKPRGKNGIRRPLRKPIYIHNNFHFGVMVCSELQNSKARISFQGKVDALSVLSWNQDLETFSTLIESAALDVHAYTILVNNRSYGDSRIRVPAKKSYNRDLARVRGGENDFVVAATLDIKELRAFQSHSKRWTQDNDKFKPLPEGFEIIKSRKLSPPIK
ncbi:RNA-directed DNA polymerase [Acinetobacter schindleri]|uniref:RNA-directed DNA polymerase n=1 Tax=Acinetobacter schindleri TaxID=108981 RepID=UPI00289E4247|nr:RNA-directed DNA polymerase [Acinetobacter schindleri]